MFKLEKIESFAHSTIVIITQILNVDIIIPRLIFDYSSNPNINQGYYMYKNISGDIITLNMNAIKELRDLDDMKTVIVYGFIHEIFHMFQNINSDYFKDKIYYNKIEDTTDYDTIYFIENNLKLIEKTFNFNFNIAFVSGIKRQLEYNSLAYKAIFDNCKYIANTIAGALSSKLNLNYDYIRNLLENTYSVEIIFPDKSTYHIDLGYGTMEELNILINLIYLSDFKFIHIKEDIEHLIVNFYLYKGEIQ